jgi:phytoene dehydrogenase-like protein
MMCFVLELAQRAKRYGAKLQTGADVVEIRMVDGKDRGARMQSALSSSNWFCLASNRCCCVLRSRGTI